MYVGLLSGTFFPSFETDITLGDKRIQLPQGLLASHIKNTGRTKNDFTMKYTVKCDINTLIGNPIKR